MDSEELRETIQNFRYYTTESKRLYSSLEDGGMDLMNMMINSSKKDSQIRRRLEKMERRTSALLKAMEQSGLSDKEWTVVDLSMEGMSHKAIGEVLQCSGVHTGRHLTAACRKMSNLLQGKG